MCLTDGTQEGSLDVANTARKASKMQARAPVSRSWDQRQSVICEVHRPDLGEVLKSVGGDNANLPAAELKVSVAQNARCLAAPQPANQGGLCREI